MVGRDELTGTFSYCCLLVCCMNGNAANFCGVILVFGRVVVTHVIMSMVIPS